MKKLFLLFVLLTSAALSVSAHQINEYKYVYILNQDDTPKDVEERMTNEFTEMGFIVLSQQDFEGLSDADKKYVLSAKYRCRQSAECLIHIWLNNQNGDEVYEDEQISGAGFMSKKNDRQSALKKIFKQLKKLNYQFEETSN